MRRWHEHHLDRLVALGILSLMGLSMLPGSALARPAADRPAQGASATTSEASTSGWQSLTNPPPFDPGGMFLLTDGTVMVQDLGPSAAGSADWWRLTPDSSGSYLDGTWSRAASLPSYYGPDYYAAAVLPDGRLAIAGGEYNNGVGAWTNLGAIYDPAANAWTIIAPPNGGLGDWSNIGDAPSEVLADGRWLVGGSGTRDDAILDPSTLTWATTGAPGKVIGNGEAGFTLLPTGNVLTADVAPPACTTRGTEILDPATLAWSSAGATPAPLVGCGGIAEIGPQILMYDGKVFVEGATSATALYDVASGTWSAGPSFPVVGGQQQGAGDAGAALLPDGKVLVATRATEGGVNGSHLFLFDGTSLTQLADNATSSSGGAFFMLLLPTGQVLSEIGHASLQIFTESGSPDPAWAPSVTSVPTTLAAGHTYTVDGHQLNGLSDGAAFGDDLQDSTDYPLVQLTSDDTGAVTYARTSMMANRSIAPGAFSCANFTLPAGIPTGASELRVIANGIPSSAIPVAVGSTGANTTSCVPLLLTRPAVSGVPAVGRLLTSSAGSWNNATTYAYRWQRCRPDGSACTVIPGATTSTHQLTDADAGSTLRAAVRASNGNSSADFVTSDATAVIAPAPVATGVPVVHGSPIVGRRLSTTAGTWSTAVTLAYHWVRCSSAGASCTPVGGATSSTYVLTKADAGHRLGARVSAINAAGGTAVAASPLTPLVVGLPRAKTKPRITGRPLVGKRLTAGHGVWSGPAVGYEYRWLRCSRKGARCSAIARAARTKYKLRKRDVGHRLRVRVTAIDAAGAARATSPATRVVAEGERAR